jgi:glycerate dehydrogenase
MKIVILDGHTLNPGDLSWSRLEQLAETKIYARTTSEQILERSQDAELILTNKVKLTKDLILKLPKLKYIGVLATGVNNIDLDAAKEAKICVCNIPSYGASSVAQHVFALLTTICNRISDYSTSINQWTKSEDFCYWHHEIRDLSEMTLGLIGFGEIATKVAEIANAFGMHVLAYKPKPNNSGLVEFVSLENLLEQSDVVSLHCPLTTETQQMINKTSIESMKSDAILINTARGGLIDEQALANALNNDKLFAAGLDVLSVEPANSDNPLLSAKNCFITPHIAWASKKARQKLLDICCDNVAAFLKNMPQNTIF